MPARTTMLIKMVDVFFPFVVAEHEPLAIKFCAKIFDNIIIISWSHHDNMISGNIGIVMKIFKKPKSKMHSEEILKLVNGR